MVRFLETATSDSVHTEGSGEEEERAEFISFGVLPLAMAIGILTRTTIAKWIPIPYTVLLLIWGAIFGAAYTGQKPFNPALNNSMAAWLSMDPRMLQVVFLPILIFASAFNAQFHILERRLGQIIFLALPGVIVGACLTATFMKYVLPYDWDWNLCLVFGSMVAATDPVAVVALLEELGVSEKLGTLIEGESLLNDGSAIVVFEVFLEAVEGTNRTWYEVIEFGSRLALGGPAIGMFIGLLGAFVLGYVINDPLVEVPLTIVLTYCTFALCEDTSIKVSGVLGIVALGVVLSYYGKPRVSSSVLPSLRDFWKTLQFFADTTIFFLSGLIVVGVAINDRAIEGRDYGYLLALFVALYVIRGLVVLMAYPVLRSGEYKITVPQMMILTHAGLRGAVALILALVVDGVYEIDAEDRDKIVFHTAGVAVLSLLFNGTTTGPLVRFLKLDRASEASQSVFGNACFALEVSMEKQAKSLREDPFLGDANWGLVWRYIPLFTADTYWHRLSKGHIVLSQCEVMDVTEANGIEHKFSTMTIIHHAVGRKKGYAAIPHRLRNPWFTYNTHFKFEYAGGVGLWGNLNSFLANHTAGDDHGEAWTGHLKYSAHDSDDETGQEGKEDGSASSARSHSEVITNDTTTPRASALSAKQAGLPRSGFVGGTSVGGTERNDTNANAPAAATAAATLASGGDDASSDSSQDVIPVEEFNMDDRRDDKGKLRRSFSRRMFQRAASMVRAAGMDMKLHESMEEEEEVKEEELIEARLRFLAATKAEYSKAKREGKLGSSGLRVLTESIHYAVDKVEKGACLDSWSSLRGHFQPGMLSTFAKYLNWWPARPVTAAAIARRLSFQLEMAWNFLEGHHESNLKSLLANNGQVSKIQREMNTENQKQIDQVEDQVTALTMDAPLVTRSVKTRTAARVMIQRYREAVELLADNGHLEDKEEEKLMNAVTDAELKLAYHPNLESLPDLPHVLEKIEFLYDLTPADRLKVIEVGAAYFQEYVGEVRLLEIGKIGARRSTKSLNRDFCGWFFVVRGNVERETRLEDGTIDACTHSAGLLFGITDSMLKIPHHAGYLTHGFSDVVVFDRMKLLKLAEEMPALDKSLWSSVGAHVLRRSSRFLKYKLASCHGLTDNATLLSGSGEDGNVMHKSSVELEANEALILVRGKVMSTEGDIKDSALGQPDTTVAPVLLENDEASGGTVTITFSSDYKALKVPPNGLINFSREETGRMARQETMRRRSMSLSTLNSMDDTDMPEDARIVGMRHLLDTGMSGKYPERDARVSALGVKAAMRLMAGVKKSP